jgi:hypothetical protein
MQINEHPLNRDGSIFLQELEKNSNNIDWLLDAQNNSTTAHQWHVK